MRPTGWKRAVRQAAGWGLLLAGIAGMLLPVAPGIPLVISGLAILATDYAWARLSVRKVKRWVARMRNRQPQT